MTDIDLFKQHLNLVNRVHYLTRGQGILALPSDEGHFVNENALVRIDDELESLRQTRGKPEWIDTETRTPGFDAYITMRVYRNSIVHKGGYLNDELFNGKWQRFHPNYERFCNSIGDPRVRPLRQGEQLMLSVTDPDFLSALVKGIVEYAENVLLLSQQRNES